MAELVTWFTSRLAILKFAQLLSGFIAIIFLIDGKIQWAVYTFEFFVVTVLSIITLLTLVVYFMRLHTSQTLPWVQMEIVFNAIAAILCFGFTGILTYDYAKMMNNEFTHHRYRPPPQIGEEGWRNRILIVAIAQLLAAVFYFASFYRTKAYGLK